MKMRHFLPVGLALLAAVTQADSVWSQDSEAGEASQVRRPVLLDESSESAERGWMSADQLRQARALYRTQQRIDRMERNAWLGHEPLRPAFNAVPMTRSPYVSRRVLVYPVWRYYAR